VDVKFSGIAWKKNEGIYYCSYDKPKQGSQLAGKTDQHKLFFHKLGNKQDQDQLVFGGASKPRRYIGAEVSENERWLIIYAANSTYGSEVYVQDLSKSDPIVTVVDNMKTNPGS